MCFWKLEGTVKLLNKTAGTFGYAPPEMLDFKSCINMARMDSWCLGATFFQMMTERRHFKGGTKEELLDVILNFPGGLSIRYISSEYMAVIRNLCTAKPRPRARIFPAEAKHRLKGHKLCMLLNTWDRENRCY